MNRIKILFFLFVFLLVNQMNATNLIFENRTKLADQLQLYVGKKGDIDLYKPETLVQLKPVARNKSIKFDNKDPKDAVLFFYGKIKGGDWQLIDFDLKKVIEQQNPFVDADLESITFVVEDKKDLLVYIPFLGWGRAKVRLLLNSCRLKNVSEEDNEILNTIVFGLNSLRENILRKRLNPSEKFRILTVWKGWLKVFGDRYKNKNLAYFNNLLTDLLKRYKEPFNLFENINQKTDELKKRVARIQELLNKNVLNEEVFQLFENLENANKELDLLKVSLHKLYLNLPSLKIRGKRIVDSFISFYISDTRDNIYLQEKKLKNMEAKCLIGLDRFEKNDVKRIVKGIRDIKQGLIEKKYSKENLSEKSNILSFLTLSKNKIDSLSKEYQRHQDMFNKIKKEIETLIKGVNKLGEDPS